MIEELNPRPSREEMAWQSLSGLGSTQGNGASGPTEAQQQVPNQSIGTEYTLQGVMRFLQTEWHRHERDRNSWEIERQEMKGRIAKLEGSTRKSDAGNRALKRYIEILEVALKDRDKLVQDLQAERDGIPSTGERKEKIYQNISEDVRPENPLNWNQSVKDAEKKSSEDPSRESMKEFLDKTQGELTYLMLSPLNPLPPRQATDNNALHPTFGAYSSQTGPEAAYQHQNRQRNVHTNIPRSLSRSHPSSQTPISEFCSSPDEQQFPNSRAQERDSKQTAPGQSSEERVTQINHIFDQYGREMSSDEEKRTEANGWNFNDAVTYPDADSKTHRPDTDLFPVAQDPPRSPNRVGSNRRKGLSSRRKFLEQESLQGVDGTDDCNFKVRFGLRGHLDAVRSVIFTGGGSPGEPEICTTGDDGTIKRWIIPGRYESQGTQNNDLDIQSSFTHRGHSGAVMCLASWSPSQNISSGCRAQGDGWIFSGGQDATIRVWERGRVDPKAVLDGHTDAIWAICVLPGTASSVMGQSKPSSGPGRILLASGSADGTVKVWSVSAPPQQTSPQPGGRRGSRARGNSMSSGSGFPSSPQPSLASNSPFNYTLVHSISRPNSTASPTCITPLSASEDAFVVSYADAAVLIYDTRTGEEIISMASLETYDNTMATGVNAVVASTIDPNAFFCLDAGTEYIEDEDIVMGATGSSGVMEGIIISGHEDRYIRFYDAKSGQCTYSMLAHPAAIAALSLSPDGRELVSAGHDASLRFWSLEKRSCIQEITSHRLMRGEGVCSVSWSRDGRWVVSAGGDGVVKVFAR
ncbi:BgTH12-01292 [Blumeria graminis f. sp. triticale]|uniref:BgtA-20939 n=3 Tax=Blumeria graminis TaxID=34373 RepID=A0A9X9MNR5_BLUGR|nr:hypothetical protein BGT96224_A20939 [Blumeria graminis f. sp. tritici 96224]CAD6505805.1 BgTH12-01292 [Blumeria graminis f. sp. triticale]VDB93976.1 BgtA-20939 [Blumeria graminis f. sp. tritici]